MIRHTSLSQYVHITSGLDRASVIMMLKMLKHIENNLNLITDNKSRDISRIPSKNTLHVLQEEKIYPPQNLGNRLN